MKKSELLKRLSQYADDQEVLVEAADGGFNDPVIYISAVGARKGEESFGADASEYTYDYSGNGFGAVVLGTSAGFSKME